MAKVLLFGPLADVLSIGSVEVALKQDLHHL